MNDNLKLFFQIFGVAIVGTTIFGLAVGTATIAVVGIIALIQNIFA